MWRAFTLFQEKTEFGLNYSFETNVKNPIV